MRTARNCWTSDLTDAASDEQRELRHLTLLNGQLQARLDQLDELVTGQSLAFQDELARLTEQSEQAILDCSELNESLREENEGLKSMVQHYQERVGDLTREYRTMWGKKRGRVPRRAVPPQLHPSEHAVFRRPARKGKLPAARPDQEFKRGLRTPRCLRAQPHELSHASAAADAEGVDQPQHL